MFPNQIDIAFHLKAFHLRSVEYAVTLTDLVGLFAFGSSIFPLLLLYSGRFVRFLAVLGL